MARLRLNHIKCFNLKPQIVALRIAYKLAIERRVQLAGAAMYWAWVAMYG